MSSPKSKKPLHEPQLRGKIDIDYDVPRSHFEGQIKKWLSGEPQEVRDVLSRDLRDKYYTLRAKRVEAHEKYMKDAKDRVASEPGAKSFMKRSLMEALGTIPSAASSATLGGVGALAALGDAGVPGAMSAATNADALIEATGNQFPIASTVGGVAPYLSPKTLPGAIGMAGGNVLSAGGRALARGTGVASSAVGRQFLGTKNFIERLRQSENLAARGTRRFANTLLFNSGTIMAENLATRGIDVYAQPDLQTLDSLSRVALEGLDPNTLSGQMNVGMAAVFGVGTAVAGGRAKRILLPIIDRYRRANPGKDVSAGLASQSGDTYRSMRTLSQTPGFGAAFDDLAEETFQGLDNVLDDIARRQGLSRTADTTRGAARAVRRHTGTVTQAKGGKPKTKSAATRKREHIQSKAAAEYGSDVIDDGLATGIEKTLTDIIASRNPADLLRGQTSKYSEFTERLLRLMGKSKKLMTEQGKFSIQDADDLIAEITNNLGLNNAATRAGNASIFSGNEARELERIRKALKYAIQKTQPKAIQRDKIAEQLHRIEELAPSTALSFDDSDQIIAFLSGKEQTARIRNMMANATPAEIARLQGWAMTHVLEKIVDPKWNRVTTKQLRAALKSKGAGDMIFDRQSLEEILPGFVDSMEEFAKMSDAFDAAATTTRRVGSETGSHNIRAGILGGAATAFILWLNNKEDIAKSTLSLAAIGLVARYFGAKMINPMGPYNQALRHGIVPPSVNLGGAEINRRLRQEGLLNTDPSLESNRNTAEKPKFTRQGERQ